MPSGSGPSRGCLLALRRPLATAVIPECKNRLIIDSVAAGTVRRIYSLAESGLGDVAIAAQLETECYLTPSVYKFRQGDKRFANYSAVKNQTPYAWCPSTVGKILTDRVYLGELTSLKIEVVNCKTKQRNTVPQENRIITLDAHKAIISQEQFDHVQQLRSSRNCPANARRENIFRGLLFCEYCGHPLTISRKQLLYRDADIYFCAHHFRKPEECPKTHRIYHEMLYPYVLQQIQNFAKSMKRRKINTSLSAYTEIQDLTPEILNGVIERIEIGHVTGKSRPGNIIHIYWKLK